MTYIEYALYDLDYSEEELKKNLQSAISASVHCISVPFAITKFCKTLTKDTNIAVSNAIDYPLGILDTKSRNAAVLNAIENGAEKIDIMIQNNYLNYKKYDKIRADIESNSEICKKHNVPIFYFLEYRIFTHQALIKACNLLLEQFIPRAYVSSGHMLDAIEDNVIASVLLKQKTNMETIVTANIWHPKQIDMLDKNNITNFRFTSINSVFLYQNHSKISKN